MTTGLQPQPATQTNDSRTTVDLLIHARHVLPIEPAGIVLENHSVAIESQQIVAIMPRTEAELRYAAKEVVSLDEHVLMPGLINAHTHAAMTLFRGYADDLPLMNWLQDRIWPAEGKHVSPDFVHDGTLLAAAEMLLGGVTCCNDMYFYPDAAARAFTQAGMRAMLGVTVLEFPTNYAHDADDYLAKGLAVRDQWKNDLLLSFCLAPHAPYTVSDKTFERVATLADQLDAPIHIHVHESRHEIEESLRQYGVRPLARLQRLGLLSPSLIGVHSVHLDDTDIALLAQSGASVVHNPTSNMKLASGAAPIARLLKEGVTVALGTDGAASNNRLDIFQEMRHAALLGKLTADDPSVLSAGETLYMATLGGAKSLGLDQQIGSISPGKQADLCAVKIDHLQHQPCFDLTSHLVYVLGRDQVSHVWVGGRCRVNDHTLVDVDLTDMISAQKMWQNKIHS